MYCTAFEWPSRPVAGVWDMDEAVEWILNRNNPMAMALYLLYYHRIFMILQFIGQLM